MNTSIDKTNYLFFLAEVLDFEKSFDWFVAFRSPVEIWEKHPSYLILELATYVFAVLTFKHAYRLGGRYPYFWWTTILHGLVVESLSYFLPDIDSFWHGQSMLMFLGKRLPMHIVLFYPVFLYTSGTVVARLRLKRWAEPFAMGLGVVLLDVPFDIMGIKLLWWTWHDTDPNIYDRHYWVPWTSYYFHASFASVFCFLFYGTRRLLGCTSEKHQADGFFKELVCSLITGMFAMPLGILQFIPVYHLLHDNFSIHTEVCVLMLLAIYAMVIWTSDRNPSKEARASNNKGWFDELGIVVTLHYLMYILLSVFAKPENIVSVGLHEPTGDCSLVSDVQTASGQVLKKKTFLCTSNYSEDYFDWHCLPGGKPPKDGLDWYSVCGTPYPNHLEYIVVVTSFALLGYYVYMQMLGYSGKQAPGKVTGVDTSSSSSPTKNSSSASSTKTSRKKKHFD